LLGDLLLLDAVSETLLGFENSHPMTLDECHRSQCIFDGFRELTLQGPQGGANQLSISNQLADVLTQEGKDFSKFQLDVIHKPCRFG
jgi:hypothetical protein